MERTLMHKWKSDFVYQKLNYKKCEKCGCEHYYDMEFKRYIFVPATGKDRGKPLYRTPPCI